MKPITGIKRNNRIMVIALCSLGALSAGVSPEILNFVGVQHLVQLLLILTPIQILALIYGLWGHHFLFGRSAQSKF
jgi:hypothetical protein